MQHLIDRIYARCEEIGDCWEWQGATQSRSRTPVMRHNGEHQCVRRFVAQALGHDVEGKCATYKCGNHLCVNPDHLQVMTKTALQKRTNKVNVRYMSMTRRQRMAAARRQQSKLTAQQVQAIRDDPRKQRDIAKDYGVSQATISSIKRGEIWRDYTSPFIHLIP